MTPMQVLVGSCNMILTRVKKSVRSPKVHAEWQAAVRTDKLDRKRAREGRRAEICVRSRLLSVWEKSSLLVRGQGVVFGLGADLPVAWGIEG